MTQFVDGKIHIRGAATWVVAGVLLVSGCAPIVVGDTVIGSMVATDRRTSGTQLEDEGIELRAGNSVRSMVNDRAHVNITSFNRQVLLTGEVPTDQEKRSADQLVAGTENVRRVVNELAVMPATSITQRSKDAFITGKVKASLLDAKDLFANSLKVFTERGVVYIMGRVTPREAKRAAEIARGVSGVEKVVRVVELITEEDLQRGISAPSRDPGVAPSSDQRNTSITSAPAPAPDPLAAPAEPPSNGVVVTPIPSR